MCRILITGANGQLGRALNIILKKQPQITVLNTVRFPKDYQENKEKYPQFTQMKQLDITKNGPVMALVREFLPTVIINCAAHTGVDLCETDENNAYKINAIGAKNLAMASKAVGAKIVQVSTDYVFSGEDGIIPYEETDIPDPQSVYGKTKLAGEEFIKNYCEKYYIIRTAWLYGDGKNFVKTMLKLAETKKEVNVVVDQFGTPTSAMEVARVILYLINTEYYGIYHATCEGSASWSEFAETIFEKMNLNIKVNAIPSIEYPTAAKRPPYSVLENRRLKETFGYMMKDWKDALDEYLDTIK